ncbi:MAG TPA: hypothetical protein DD379_10685, partial [Cyanobacteria bacterium UBA11162]|nr:hypothetical protein [Cyanobacteria bacterium UBA11162]
IDFLQKSGKGDRRRGKGLVFFPFPSPFNVFSPFAKETFARGLIEELPMPGKHQKRLGVLD